MRVDAENREAGVATLVLPMVLWVATLVAVVTIDIGAYLVAASRAQALADAAALAAVSVDVGALASVSPRDEAARVVRAGNGELESCDCTPGREFASVRVSTPVPGLVVPSLGASRVTATAQAMLAPPKDAAPGPSRERARWPRPPDG